jgi:rod shape determining protein RodA
MNAIGINWRNFDFWLLGAILVLTIFGVVVIRSAVAGNIELTEQNIVQRQIIFILIGLFVILIMSIIDYRLWSSINRLLYIGIVAILGGLFVIGSALFGSARWFETRYFLIQPSEPAKIVVILVLANFFAKNQGKIGNIRWILRSLLLVLGIVIWIFLQPNLSTSIVIIVLWFALLWASGLKLRYLAIIIAIGILALIIGFPLLQDYQQARILSFLFPDPNARYGDMYNIQQALISIGSGGWFGKGYGLGTQVQLRFLKVRHTDFIFSVIAEEFGFLGTALIMVLIGFVIYRCIRAARLSRDTFGALIAYGVATLIAFQTLANIGVNLRLTPATGLTLPFISYGGSSLLSLLLGIGLVESVMLYRKTTET